MDTAQYKELQKAIGYLRNSSANAKIELDYSLYSVKCLDLILSEAFRNGQLRNPTGIFDKHQGLILLAISGYLAEVILKNTSNTKLVIDQNDKKWYLTFKVTAANGSTVTPREQVMKRTRHGSEAELYAFAVSTIKSFNQSKGGATKEHTHAKETPINDYTKQNSIRPWWKFW
jgi:hypothetical protein